VERRFDLEGPRGAVPGLLWHPEAGTGPRPLVLLGHGGSLHKRSPYILSLARRLVRHRDFAAAAIDGPAHGDRRADGGTDPERVSDDFRRAWSRDGVTDEMVSDWRATLEALRMLEEVGEGPLGYWGLSMGTIFGVPLVAAEARISAAVLGLMGTFGPTGGRLADDARRIGCPVLFLQQWDDELIPRERVLDLFDALGTADKRLHVHPGKHVEVPAEEIGASEEFLADRLGSA
jgi:dienelactone hydrolase